MLNDIENGPRYPYLQNGGMTSPRTHVWIDEPGLTLRLKPLDFEGDVKASDEYSPISSWGVGCFQYAGDVTQSIVDLPPGRYRVLLHDLNYGWDLERRGTIVIGQGQQTIHVKRSFSGQQLLPVAGGASFRWAGLTYQIKNAAQMNAVNQMLAKIADQQTVVAQAGMTFQEVDFTGHPLGEQLNQLQPGPDRQLSYAPRAMRVEIPADLNIERVEISAFPMGLISWSRSSPREFHLPFGALTYEVVYKKGFSWPGSGSRLDFVPESLPKQTLTVGKPTKTDMRRMVEAYHNEAGQNGAYLGWFEDQPVSLGKQGVKPAERLLLAWLDGQPDVPETELLQIGGVETWEKLWENGQSGQPEKLMTFVLQPGSTPALGG